MYCGIMNRPAVTDPNLGLAGQPVPSHRSTVPLVAHLIHGWHCGGLEKMLATIVRCTPPDRYRHAIICLTHVFDPDFQALDAEIPVISLHKQPGQDPRAALRLYRLLRELRPAILHTRNVGTLEGQFTARLAGVPFGIHGAHGRDSYDLDGSRYLRLRKAMRPFIDHYIAVSRDLGRWLIETVDVPARHVTQIYNGVDTELFYPRQLLANGAEGVLPPASAGKLVIGTVERLQETKDPLNLLHAFIHLLSAHPRLRTQVHLLIVGDGPLRGTVEQLIEQSGIGDVVTLTGMRNDTPELLRTMDIFVLPSLAEGTSNTILEAMASGLPVVATDVGGNPELVRNESTGLLVPAANPAALADAIAQLISDPGLRAKYGGSGRERVLAHFSTQQMVETYLSVYDEVLARTRRSWTRDALSRCADIPPARIAKPTFYAGLRYGGVNRWCRRAVRRRILVLCYHGVVADRHEGQEYLYRNTVPQVEFERQMIRIRKYFSPISVSELLAHVYEEHALPEAPVLITFDDGYRNNLLLAAPILNRLEIPAVFFLSTGFIGSPANLWANEIDVRVLSAPGRWIPIPVTGGATLVPREMGARIDLAHHLRSRCKGMTHETLTQYLEKLAESVPHPDDATYRELFEFLSWDEVRELSKIGFAIGSHTVSHPILSRISLEEAANELYASKARIEAELGIPCSVIAYPNGQPADYSPQVLELAGKLGYRAGFSLRGGQSYEGNPLDIDRINVPGHVSASAFESVLSGSYAAIQKMFRATVHA